MSTGKYSVVQPQPSREEILNRQLTESRNNEARARERADQMRIANERSQSEIRTLNNQINTQIAGLSNEIRAVEQRQNRAFNDALQRQKRESDERARQLEERMENGFSRVAYDMRIQEERILTEVRTENTAIRTDIRNQGAELRNMIGRIEQEMQARNLKENEIANYWVSQAEAYITGIDEYRHDLFCPGKFQNIRSKLERAKNTPVPASVIALAIGVFDEAVELRADVVGAEVEWANNFEHLTRNIAELRSTINDTKMLNFELSGQTIPAKVDFWTEGALTHMDEIVLQMERLLKNPNDLTHNELELATETEKDELRQNPRELDNDELVRMISRTVDLKDDITNSNRGLITRARAAYMLSSERLFMANTIGNTLVREGWIVQGQTFRGGMQSDAFHIKIGDNRGNELVAVIEPKPGKDGVIANVLTLDFFNDDTVDMSAINYIIDRVQQVLNQNGIQANLQCIDGYSERSSNRHELRDIERTRNTQSEEGNRT